jgi:RNA polymerase sigma factor (TIGR02999 family)
MGTTANVTQLLCEFQNGNNDAADQLWAEVYEELHRVAHAKLLRERSDHTLNTTALVHECYLKLVDQTQVQWQSRLHFFALASRVMRNILIDYARRRNAQKRGGDAPHLQLDDVHVSDDGTSSAELFLALNKALDQLAAIDERLAKVVEYRFFGGMQEKEIAALMDLSPRTIRRDWRKAKGFLSRALADEADDSDDSDDSDDASGSDGT